MEVLGKIFIEVFQRSYEVSCVILVVLAARLLLSKFPRKYSYFLWLLVAIRVLVPVGTLSPASQFSIFNLPLIERIQENIWGLGEEKFLADMPQNVSDWQQEGKMVLSDASDITEYPGAQAIFGEGNLPADLKRSQHERTTFPPAVRITAVVWIVGVMLFCGWSMVSYAALKRRIASAVLLRDNIYECDNISTPFVLGFVNPVIYIPFRLEREEQEYILLHEQYHIRRKDYIIKLSAFLMTAVFWFNPLVWAAYFLMIRDMEMSCDEKVILEIGMDIKEKYSMSLLSFATNHRLGLANPLAFGEGDTRKRVKNVLDIKKPKFWFAAIGLVVFLVAGVLCLTGKMVKGDEVQDDILLKLQGENAFSMVEPVSDAINPKTEDFVRQWAQCYSMRDGDTLLTMAQEELWESLPFMEIGEEYVSFGMSSPWPWGEVPFVIQEISGDEAVIFYYAQTSDPHVWVWRETIRFRETDGKLTVYEEELTGVNGINTLEEMKLLYPDGKIAGTGMDYRTNGLGTYLQQNYLQSRLSYSGYYLDSLDDAVQAAYLLLNIADDENIMASVYNLQNDEKTEIIFYFQKENEAVLVTMERVKDIDGDFSGIWIPVEITFAGHDEKLIDYVIQHE